MPRPVALACLAEPAPLDRHGRGRRWHARALHRWLGRASIYAQLPPTLSRPSPQRLPACLSTAVQWGDEAAMQAARDDFLARLADPQREMIGPQQVADVRQAVQDSGGAGFAAQDCFGSGCCLAYVACVHRTEPALLQQAHTCGAGASPVPALHRVPARVRSGGGSALAGAGQPDRVLAAEGAQAVRNSGAAAQHPGLDL